MGEEQQEPAPQTGIDASKIAYRGEVELINAAWSLDSGRTVELRLVGDACTRLHPFKVFQKKRNGRMGTRFHFAVADTKTGDIVHRGECMLAGWKESSFSGQCITLWLDDDTERHPFAGLNRRKNGDPGDLLYVALVEIGDDERPVRQDRPDAEPGADVPPDGEGGQPAKAAGMAGGAARGAGSGSRARGAAPRRSKPSQVAHLLVTSNMFVRYLTETRARREGWDAERARRWVKHMLKIESLSQLDKDPAALARYEEHIRRPYARWKGDEP